MKPKYSFIEGNEYSRGYANGHWAGMKEGYEKALDDHGMEEIER